MPAAATSSSAIPSAATATARATRRQGQDRGGVARRARRDRLRRRDQAPSARPAARRPSSRRSSPARSRRGRAADRLVVAYEPVWAIGTGLTPTLADIADDARSYPRRIFRPARASSTAARSTRGTPPTSSRSPMSTARWSAAPASRPTISGRSSQQPCRDMDAGDASAPRRVPPIARCAGEARSKKTRPP